MNIDWNAAIQILPLLKDLPASLREVVGLQHFSAGETLHRRGEHPAAMLCVLAGELRLVRHGVDGEERVMQRKRNGFVAEASMESDAYHWDIVATADGNLLRIPIPAFRAALEEAPDFRRAWLQSLTREVRALRAQSERLRLNSAAERILHYIETEGSEGAVILLQTRKAWAAELGLSHEALYRALRRLREEGVLRDGGTRIEILRRDARAGYGDA
jgi:CRP-like cAMP-binding protein